MFCEICGLTYSDKKYTMWSINDGAAVDPLEVSREPSTVGFRQISGKFLARKTKSVVSSALEWHYVGLEISLICFNCKKTPMLQVVVSGCSN